MNEKRKGWRRDSFDIAIRPYRGGGTKKVFGWVYEPFGLNESGPWVVTALPGGWRICWAPTVRQAKQIAGGLRKLDIDWSAEAAEIVRQVTGKNLRKDMLEVIGRHGGEE